MCTVTQLYHHDYLNQTIYIILDTDYQVFLGNPSVTRSGRLVMKTTAVTFSPDHQRLLNAAERLITDTHKFDHGLSRPVIF